MKKIFFTITAILAVFTMASCDKDIEPSGRVIAKNYSYTNFSGIEVSSGFKLNITQNDNGSVSVTADENYQSHVICEQEGKTLKIYKKRNSDFGNNPEIVVNVSVKQLNKISATGGSIVKTIGTFNANDLDIESSGGSIWNIDFVATKMDIDASGGSILNFIGSATNVDFDFSGGSIFKGKDFLINNCDIDASGGSIFYINSLQNLKVDASGGSIVYYTGTPMINQNLSGGSQVIKE